MYFQKALNTSCLLIPVEVITPDFGKLAKIYKKNTTKKKIECLSNTGAQTRDKAGYRSDPRHVVNTVLQITSAQLVYYLLTEGAN